jgi:hypothetical protein
MGMKSLDQNFKDFLEYLNLAKIKYLVLGGYAVNYYGYERHTKDLDVWVATDEVNLKALSKVMQSFGGFPARDVPPSMFTQAGKAFAFGREPIRIDILTGPSGVEFAACYSRRREVIMDGVRVPLISLEDLKINKLASGRTQDIADVELLPLSWPPKARQQINRSARKAKRS